MAWPAILLPQPETRLGENARTGVDDRSGPLPLSSTHPASGGAAGTTSLIGREGYDDCAAATTTDRCSRVDGPREPCRVLSAGHAFPAGRAFLRAPRAWNRTSLLCLEFAVDEFPPLAISTGQGQSGRPFSPSRCLPAVQRLCAASRLGYHRGWSLTSMR